AAVSYSPNPITPASPICGNPVANSVNWTALNNGYEVTQFYDGAVYPDNSAFFGGTQDNGTPRGTVGGGRNAWASILGGDRRGVHQFQHRVCGGPNRVHLEEYLRPYGRFRHHLVLQPGPARYQLCFVAGGRSERDGHGLRHDIDV